MLRTRMQIFGSAVALRSNRKQPRYEYNTVSLKASRLLNVADNAFSPHAWVLFNRVQKQQDMNRGECGVA